MIRSPARVVNIVIAQRTFAVAVFTTHTGAMNERVLRTAYTLAKRANAELAVIEMSTEFEPARGLLFKSDIEKMVDEMARDFSGTVLFRRLPLLPQTPYGEGKSVQNDAEAATMVVTGVGQMGVSMVVVGVNSNANPLGGIAGQLVALSDIPIVVVPANGVELCEDPFHLVVAIDETPNVGSIAARISELHVWFDVTVSLLHVSQPGGGRINGVSVLAHDRAAHQLQRCASRLHDFGVDDTRIHTAVRTGPPPNVIVDQIRREHATLGVLPETSSAGHHRRPNGVSNDVLIESPVPILLFSTAGASDRGDERQHLTTIQAVGR